jgi:hypothetical protein
LLDETQEDQHHPVDPIPTKISRRSTRKASMSINLYLLDETQEDQHHPVDAIPTKRPADQQEKPPCQSIYIC